MGVLSFINKLFKPKQSSNSNTTVYHGSDAYFFHEDYYCQIEYLPIENLPAVSKMAKDISIQSEKSFDGNGWSEIFVRSGFPVPTKSKKYGVEEFVDFLKSFDFKEYPKVTTGYGQTTILCENARAFRKHSIVICFDYENDLIKNIWENTAHHTGDNEFYKSFLVAIAKKYNLLLVNWWKLVVADILNRENIDKYFEYDE